jgi:uroporphyrinogen decarboxylase
MPTPKEIVLDAIHHRQPVEVPYTLDFEGDVADRLDTHYGSSHWREQIKTYMVGVSAVDTDYKEPISPTHVRDTYGSIWRQDMLPWHLETPILSQPDFAGYDFPPAKNFFRPVIKAQGFETCAKNPDFFLVGHMGWGLFERCWTLRGFEAVLMDSIEHPEFLAELLDALTNLYLGLIGYTADLPVDALMFGDDWGDQRGVILGARRWRKFIKPCWAKLYAAAHERGKLVLHHSCGSVAEIIPDIIEIGVDVLESVQPEAAGMNPYELKQKYGDKITFWGGLGSQSVLPFGTPDQIRTEVRRLKTKMGQGGGYILAPAKPLQPETPTLNAAAAVEAFTEG